MNFYDTLVNPESRFPYLENISSQINNEYVSKIKYINKVTDYCMDIDCHPSCRNFLVSGLKSKVNVYPFTFENDFVQTETDFLSILIDHECFHALEYYNNPRMIVPTKNLSLFDKANFIIDLELRAYNNQIQAINNGRNVSKKFLSNLESRILRKKKLKNSFKQENIIFSIA